MLIVSPTTASAFAPHASGNGQAWVMFVQVSPPGGAGPIKIEGAKGTHIGRRLAELARDNPFDPMLIGLVSTMTPLEHAEAIGEQYEAARIRDDWFHPVADLLAYIQHIGQAAIQELLAATHPGGINEAVVDIERMAEILGVSVPTVRRMTKAGEIPSLRGGGRTLRYVPEDVIASMQRRNRR